MFNVVLEIFLLIVFAFCTLSVAYFFVFSLAAALSRKKKNVKYSQPVNRIAVLVPAYKEDNIILFTAESLLKLNYPQELYDVYIIADSFDPFTIFQLKQLSLNVLEVSFKNSTKTKALNKAFEAIKKQYDIALICDADNILAKDFLKYIDHEFKNGAKAVQGRRVAKNLDTEFAMLDAFSEAINNHIFRKGADALGLSSPVVGSGMAFEFNMAKNILSQISAIGGFDKALQLDITDSGIKIRYLENALIFDEKIDNPHAFKQQKKRWLLSQFTYLKKFFVPGFKQVFKGNFSYFNLAVLNNIVLPRIFLIFGLLLLTLISYFVQPITIFILFASITVLYFITLFIAIPKDLKNRKMLPALLQLPKAVFLMLLSLFAIKKAKKVFIHTVHTKNEVSNPLYNLNDN